MTNPNSSEVSLGAAIRDARRRAHLNQAELGEFVGTDRYTIANLEKGQFTTQVRRLMAVLDAVGLELAVVRRSPPLPVDGAPTSDAVTP